MPYLFQYPWQHRYTNNKLCTCVLPAMVCISLLLISRFLLWWYRSITEIISRQAKCPMVWLRLALHCPSFNMHVGSPHPFVDWRDWTAAAYRTYAVTGIRKRRRRSLPKRFFGKDWTTYTSPYAHASFWKILGILPIHVALRQGIYKLCICPCCWQGLKVAEALDMKG